MRHCTIRVAKTKNGAFVFALAKILFSHDEAHLMSSLKLCV